MVFKWKEGCVELGFDGTSTMGLKENHQINSTIFSLKSEEIFGF